MNGAPPACREVAQVSNNNGQMPNDLKLGRNLIHTAVIIWEEDKEKTWIVFEENATFTPTP